MKRKVFATLCAAAMMLSVVSPMGSTVAKAAPAPIASYDFEAGFGDMTATANGETAAPTVVTDEVKGSVVQLEFGANAAESYTSFANPYVGKELTGATMMAWVKVPSTAAFWEYDNLIGFTDGTARWTLETMPYVCWNAGAEDNWIDLKAAAAFTGKLDTWQHFAVTVNADGATIYVNGAQVEATPANGAGYNAASMLTFLSAETTQAYLGFGSFWGSQGSWMDDVMFYDTVLTADEIKEVANVDAVLAADAAANAPELPAVEALASYNFEDGFGDMTAASNGGTVAPSIVADEAKGNVVKLEFGANAAESYTSFANPYAGKELTAATMMAWVKVPEGTANFEWDNLIGFTNGTARLTLQTRPYVCWNAGADENWIDAKGALVFGKVPGTWQHYTVTVSADGVVIFVNGEQVEITDTANGTGYDAASMLAFLSGADVQAYLGNGSFWGTQACLLDDVAFYDVALTTDEIKAIANVDAVLATNPAVTVKVDLNTVAAAVPEDYAHYYSFDGNLTDAVTGQSGNPVGHYYNLEAEYGPEASYEEGMNGQAVAFYGFGDGVKLPTVPTGSQYTISVDWYLKGVSQYGTGIFMTNLYEDGTLKGSDEDGQWISIAPLGTQTDVISGPMVWSRNVPGGAAWNDLFSAENNSIALEKWLNLTVVADGAVATIYVDGSPIVTGPIADIIDETTAMYLGVNAWDTVFNGYMDNLYIYNRTLSADEVAGLAKASLTPDPIDMDKVEAKVAEGYSAYYSFDGNLTDEVSGQSGTPVGYYYNLEAEYGPEASYEDGLAGQAVAFYGFGDGVKLPTVPKSNTYTISVDWYLKGVSQYGTGIFMTNLYEDGVLRGGDEDAQWISIAPLGTQTDVISGPMVWSRNVPGGAAWNDLFKAENNSIALEKWFNLTLVAENTTATIYVDGLPVVTGPIAAIIDDTTAMYLGVNAWDAVFNGYMDNLYIYDRALDAKEVAALAKASLTPVETPAPTEAPVADPTAAPEATTAPEATKAPETTEAPANTDAEDDSTNTGLIIGIVVVVAVVVVAAVAVVVSKKKKASK